VARHGASQCEVVQAFGQAQSFTGQGRAGIRSGTALDSARTCRYWAGTEIHRARTCRHRVRHIASQGKAVQA